MWLRSLPPDQITHLRVGDEVRYDHSKTVGETLTVANAQVTKQYVWLFTDIEFYATAPVSAMNAPPANLAPEALVGLLRLTILFGSAAPIQTRANVMSPYTSPNQVSSTTSGWPWLQTPFGAQRALSFALYAQANEQIRLTAFVEARPRFPIDRIGVNLHGAAVPISTFSSVWKKGGGESSRQ